MTSAPILINGNGGPAISQLLFSHFGTGQRTRKKKAPPNRRGLFRIQNLNEAASYYCGFGCAGAAGFGAADFPGVGFAAPAFTG
jgi:hypothetical protein